MARVRLPTCAAINFASVGTAVANSARVLMVVKCDAVDAHALWKRGRKNGHEKFAKLTWRTRGKWPTTTKTKHIETPSLQRPPVKPHLGVSPAGLQRRPRWCCRGGYDPGSGRQIQSGRCSGCRRSSRRWRNPRIETRHARRPLQPVLWQGPQSRAIRTWHCSTDQPEV